MKKYGIGIIGYGGFGAFIHKAWDEMDNAYVGAVCDSNVKRKPDGVTFYTSPEELFRDPKVDIVSVATPPSSHKELAIKAMRAGKNVLVEKPLALTEKDAKEIKEVSDETGKTASVNFVLRYNPVTDLLHTIISKEVFGKLRRIDLRNYAMQETVPEGHWFWNPEVSGRILIEHGVHFFDLASYMTNSKAEKIWSTSAERKPGMEDRVFAVVNYENDVIGTFWHSFSRPRELETTTFHFAFDLGEIDMVGWIPLGLNIWGWTDKKGKDILYEELGDIGAEKAPVKSAKSSEFEYKIDYEVNIPIELEDEKLDVYAESLRMIMGDLIKKIEKPSHKMLVTLDDGIEAVRIAEQATKAVHP